MINHKAKPGIIICIILVTRLLQAQEELILGGGFQANANLFIRDSLRGAINIPQYDHELYGAESWLNLNASYKGFSGGIRFDAFHNSNLLNPTSSYTEYGIGQWYIKKETDNFEVQAGYIYDQIGSGIIYRAYEERTQLIDNALIGVMGKYIISENWSVRAFTGKQRNLFESTNAIIKGVAISGFYKPNDSSSLTLAPGFGFVNRTFGEALVTQMASIISEYQQADQFNPYYNGNAVTLFNNLNYKNWNWYFETAFKPRDIFFDPNAKKLLPKGNSTVGKLVSENGSVLYTSLSFVKNQLGLTAEWKRTENFSYRSEPLLKNNNSLIGYIPPMAKLNTFRLTSYYSPATQFLDEMAIQFDLKYGIGDHWNFSLNYSDIRDKKFDRQFYNEFYVEAIYKKEDHYQLTAGLQLQTFDIELYFGKPGEEDVKTVTPFAEFLYKFSESNSLRIESQYMDNKHDKGSWVYGLIEFGIAPRWLFEISDMYNTQPTKGQEALHYPTAGIVFSQGANRFALRYVKQLEGIVCSGGICRLEPAFSGIKASITSTF